MSYGLLVTLHLLMAIAFAGTVFFEVIILEGVKPHVPRPSMVLVEKAIGNRAVHIMPFVLLTLYAIGITLAWHHREVLAHPFDSHFAFFLTIKIMLATSVFGHFLTAMFWRKRGTLNGKRSKWIHISIFCHIFLIVILAKMMYYG